MSSPEAPSSHSEWDKLRIIYATALWAWAEVDAQLFSIYAAAVSDTTGDLRPLRAAFFAIVSFEARLAATHAAFKEKWGNKPYIAIWGPLHKRCDKARAQRGSIAHLSGTRIEADKPHRKPIHVLIEPRWHHRHPQSWGQAKSEGFDFMKLSQFAYEWMGLSSELGILSRNLWIEAQREASLPPQADQPRRPHMGKGDQTPKELPSPHESSQG